MTGKIATTGSMHDSTLAPDGAIENSPALQCWVNASVFGAVPEGRLNVSTSRLQSSLRDFNDFGDTEPQH